MGLMQYYRAISAGEKLDLTGFEPETVRTILMMAPLPKQKHADQYDVFIKAVKTGHSLTFGLDNLLQVFDSLTIGCAHSRQAALLNYVKNSNHKSAYIDPAYGVDPRFEVNRGYHINPNQNSYIRSNFSPSIDGVNFHAQNLAFGIFMINKAPGTAAGAYMGDGSSGGHCLYEQTNPVYRWYIGRANSSVPQQNLTPLFDNLSTQNFVAQGFRIGNLNGVKVGANSLTVSTAVTVASTGQFYEGCRRRESDNFGQFFPCTSSDEVFNGGSYYGSGTIDASVMNASYKSIFNALNF